jgi:hypothetical protein
LQSLSVQPYLLNEIEQSQQLLNKCVWSEKNVSQIRFVIRTPKRLALVVLSQQVVGAGNPNRTTDHRFRHRYPL